MAKFVYKPVPYEKVVLEVFVLTYIPPEFLHYYFEDIDESSSDSEDWNEEQRRIESLRAAKQAPKPAPLKKVVEKPSMPIQTKTNPAVKKIAA